MLLKWHGHSCFSVVSKERTLLIDPFDEGVGYPLPAVRPSIIVESHQHHDHNSHDRYAGEYVLINRTGKTQAHGFSIEGYPTFHDEFGGKKRGPNIVFEIITPDGFRIVHCGDLGHRLTEELSSRLEGPDVLLIPVGGVYTIDAAVAREITRRIGPSFVVPMHYKTKALRFELGSVDPFIAGEPFESLKELRLETKSSVGTKIVVLSYS